MVPEPSTPVPGRESTPLASAAPSRLARVLAVAAIVVAGACGALIGYAVIDLLYDSAVGAALGALVGAVGAAAGVAVVVNLTLQAMAEWKALERRDRDRGGVSRPQPPR